MAAAASPYVEKVLIYQYQGMMNARILPLFGHPDSASLDNAARQSAGRKGWLPER